jgi:mRNA interferase RelE/StbE
LAYKISFKKSVSKDLKKLDKSEASRILDKLEAELPAKADKLPELKGNFAGLRKFRIGDYRVIFTISEDYLVIARIQHRKDVYKD